MRVKRALSVILNLLMLAGVAASVLYIVLVRASGNMAISGTYAFMFFTVDSNILCALACLLMIPAQLRLQRPPRWLVMFKYVSTVAVAVTLSVVVLFLGPVMRYDGLFAGANLYLHLLCPAAAILSLSFFDGGERIGKRGIWLSVLPVIVYGSVYLTEVVVIGPENGGWADFYGFNRGGHWYLSFAAMLAGTALLGLILQAVHDRFCERKREEEKIR